MQNTLMPTLMPACHRAGGAGTPSRVQGATVRDDSETKYPEAGAPSTSPHSPVGRQSRNLRCRAQRNIGADSVNHATRLQRALKNNKLDSLKKGSEGH
jgi:hypothetical protein